jgi:DNA-binding Lrp family transcriptional regulator
MAPGVSAEEKRRRIQELFMEKPYIFSTKELETTVAKRTGISSMIIKDIVKEMADESLIDTAKVGISSCFWRFRTKATAQAQLEYDDALAKHEAAEQALTEARTALTQAEIDRDDTTERQQAIREFAQVRSELAAVNAQLAAAAEFDPVSMQTRRDALAVAIDAANRWTDNIYSVRSYCEKQLGVPRSDLNPALGINDGFDYFDPPSFLTANPQSPS